MRMKEGNDKISPDTIPMVNGIHSAMTNMESCSVMITDPAPHHDTPSTPSICLDKAAIVIKVSTPWHSLHTMTLPPHHDTPSTPSIYLDKAAIVIKVSTPMLHLQPTISIP